MQSVSDKIALEASRLARAYVNILRDGGEPALLRAQIEENKYDIMEAIGDGRLNMSKTLERVYREAKWRIEVKLENEPALKALLIDYRAERAAKEAAAAAEEQKNWRPLPKIGANN